MKTQIEMMKLLTGDLSPEDEEKGRQQYERIAKTDEVRNLLDMLIKEFNLSGPGEPAPGALTSALMLFGKIQAAVLGTMYGIVNRAEKTEDMSGENFIELMNLQLICQRMALEGEVPDSLKAYADLMRNSFGPVASTPNAAIRWAASMCAAILSGTLKTMEGGEDDRVYIVVRTVAHLFYVGLVTAIEKDKAVDVGRIIDILGQLIRSRFDYDAEHVGNVTRADTDELSKAFGKK